MAVVPADSDARLIALWLHGRAARTQRSYHADANAFLGFVQKPLRQITLGDLQAYQDSLVHLATASQARRLSAGRPDVEIVGGRRIVCPACAGAGVVRAPVHGEGVSP